jgi:hypothetical protein
MGVYAEYMIAEIHSRIYPAKTIRPNTVFFDYGLVDP